MPTTRLAFPGGHYTRPRCSTARTRPAVTPAQTASTAPATPTAVAGSDRTTQGGGACVVTGTARGHLVDYPR